MVVFAASVLRVEFSKFLEDDTPRLCLFFGVLNSRKWFTAVTSNFNLFPRDYFRSLEKCQHYYNSLLVVVSDVGKVLPPGSVDRIGETGMIGIQLGAVRQNLICELVKVSNSSWKPRNGVCKNNKGWVLRPRSTRQVPVTLAKLPWLSLWFLEMMLKYEQCWRRVSIAALKLPPGAHSTMNSYWFENLEEDRDSIWRRLTFCFCKEVKKNNINHDSTNKDLNLEATPEKFLTNINLCTYVTVLNLWTSCKNNSLYSLRTFWGPSRVLQLHLPWVKIWDTCSWRDQCLLWCTGHRSWVLAESKTIAIIFYIYIKCLSTTNGELIPRRNSSGIIFYSIQYYITNLLLFYM